MALQRPWLVLVASCWIEATAGISYTFGTYSSAIKSSLQFSQSQISGLGVAKDLGDTLALAAGFASKLLPTWAVLSLGALLILLGYGCLWFIVVNKTATIPFWVLCALIFVGTNGTTYLDMAALVSCIHSFPRNSGMVVALLKAFKGLSGAIFDQIYTSFLAPSQATFILMVAVGPTVVVLALMFVVRPIHSSSAGEMDAEASTFNVIYVICLILAAYMLSVTLVQDLTTVSDTVSTFFLVGLFILLALPLAAPMSSTILRGLKSPFSRGRDNNMESPLLEERSSACSSPPTAEHLIIHEEEADNRKETRFVGIGVKDTDANLPENPLLLQGSREGEAEDLTLSQALCKADFWLLFISVCLGLGSGITAINNLGQIAQSQGYQNAEVFVSMINIWSFLGRLGGGYASEISLRSRVRPRPVVLAAAQMIMCVGHFLFAMAWPGSIYGATLLVGLSYGAHWAIFPTMALELFGMKDFSLLYGFLSMAIPVGSLVFSQLIAGTIYDWEAKKQDDALECEGKVCFELTFLIMIGVCMVAASLSVVLAMRTRLKLVL